MESSGFTVIQMTPNMLHDCMQSAATYGAHVALSLAGLPVKEFFTKTELVRKFGRRKVDPIVKQLTPQQFDGEGRLVYSITDFLSKVI